MPSDMTGRGGGNHWPVRAAAESLDEAMWGHGAEYASAPGRIRTCDFCLRRAALYPLSYGRLAGQSTLPFSRRRAPAELWVNGPAAHDRAMLIAVIADTHLPRGGRRLPEACLERIREADLLLHAGDFMT